MATFGNTNKGANAAGGYDGTYAVKTLFTAPENGTVTSISCYTGGGSGVTIDLGMYSGVTLLTRANVAAAADGWVTADVPDEAIVNGVVYGLAFKTIGTSALTYYYDGGDVNQSQRNFSLTAGDNLPATFTVSNQVARNWSIYATYTPSAGGLSIPVAMHHYNRINKVIRG